ncbi:hypothetical protein ACOMHN_044822 [Nucella lapillus]
MIPFLATTSESAASSALSSNTTDITTPPKLPSSSTADPENLPPTTTMTTTATTTTETDSALKFWTSKLKESLENMTVVPPSGDDVAVDVGGGGGLHTPLNAPQPSLKPVTQSSSSSSSSFGSSANLLELGWIIPISVISLVLMVALALALYYGVRKLELRMLSWCYRNCGCCCAPGGGGGGRRGGRALRGEQYDTLSEEESGGKKETVRLREFREGSPGYGMTRKLPKEYSPKRESSPSFDCRDG